MTEQTASKVPQIRLKGFDRAWEDKTLGELCEPLSYGLNAAAMKFDGANKYLRITDIDDETRTFSQSDITSPNKELSTAASYILEPGDIVFARTGASVGKTYLYKKEDGRVFFAGFLIRARKKSNVDEEFLFQNTLLSKYRAFVKLTSQRSGQPGINAQEYSSYSLNCPSHQEQTQIGEYFRELDSLIGLHQRKHDKLVTLKKAMLQKMFPQDGVTNPEIRFNGFSENWEKVKLGNVASLINGRAYSQEELLKNGKYKVLRVGNFYTNSSWYFSNMELTDKYYAQTGDLLYTWSASFGPHIWNDGKVIFHYHIWKIELTNKVCRAFLLQLLENDKESILSNSNGSAMVHITKGGMELKEFLIPHIAEQQKIGTYFRTLDELISKHAIQLKKLQQIKSACLEKMFV